MNFCSNFGKVQEDSKRKVRKQSLSSLQTNTTFPTVPIDVPRTPIAQRQGLYYPSANGAFAYCYNPHLLTNSPAPQSPRDSYQYLPIEAYGKNLRVFENANFIGSLRQEKPVPLATPRKTSQTLQLIPLPQPAPYDRYSQKRVLLRRNSFIVYDKVLGSGSFSKVYLGLHEPTNTKVAIKEISELNSKEVNLLASIHSQYVLKMIDHWKTHKKLFVVLELCEGSLKDRLKNLSLQEAMRVFEEIMMGMKDIHDSDIVHQDIKLDNILIKDGKVKISDFGLATKIDQTTQNENVKCGTPQTMAPQLFFGFQSQQKKQKNLKKCDIWSLGVILHELIYKTHPFNCEIELFKKCKRIKMKKPIKEIQQILRRCLILNPSDRADVDQILLMTRQFNNQLRIQKISDRKRKVEKDIQDKDIRIQKKINQKRHLNLLSNQNDQITIFSQQQKIIQRRQTTQCVVNQENLQSKNLFLCKETYLVFFILTLLVLQLLL